LDRRQSSPVGNRGEQAFFAGLGGKTMNGSRAVSYDSAAAVAIGDQRKTGLELLGELGQALAQGDPAAQHYLLLLRFILANLIALALAGAAAGQGWIGMIFKADTGGYSLAIVAVFLVGLLWSGHRALQISRGLNEIKQAAVFPRGALPPYLRLAEARDGQSRALLASTLRLKLAARITPIRHIANSLVLLGLIGTVIGFVIALSGVRPEVVSNVDAIGPMVSTLIGGMSIALHTTLVGSLLHLWLMVNVRLLEGGTVKLLTATVEAGERHARL
jgi:MotA/TolQ/ExbB proton channel family